jgi:hypothetical protein
MDIIGLAEELGLYFITIPIGFICIILLIAAGIQDLIKKVRTKP